MDAKMTLIARLSTLAAIVALGGCAHPITLTPDNQAISSVKIQQIPRNVGYYISAEDRDKEFVTAGGGGDKVSHHPYRDIEPGLYMMLSNVFANVTPLKAANDSETIRGKGISFVFVPSIVPESSSDGVFTWPPTNFSVKIDCVAFDANGKRIATKSVQGVGAATFSEFRAMGFGLSGRRAATDALLKLQDELSKAPEFK